MGVALPARQIDGSSSGKVAGAIPPIQRLAREFVRREMRATRWT